MENELVDSKPARFPDLGEGRGEKDTLHFREGGPTDPNLGEAICKLCKLIWFTKAKIVR